jgi:single-strand DNA-binding protein
MSLFDLNRATLIGNVTKDPQLRYTGKGTAVLSFSIATNRSMQNEDGSYKDMPTFHNIVCWSKLAERMAKVMTKGKKVYIEGRIENRSYEQEGVKKYTSEVVADNIIVFDRTARAGEGGGSYAEDAPSPAPKPRKKKSEPEPTESDEMEQVDPEDIPF